MENRPLVLGLLLALLPACRHSGSSTAPVRPDGNAALDAVQYGRLVDVYGLRTTAQGTLVELYRNDVLVGPDIQDERTGGAVLSDEEILYDFVGSNPDSLQPRLLVTREIDSPEFAAALAALDDQLTLVTPGRFAPGAEPVPVVPRNAALRLTFSRELVVDASFFAEIDAQGRVLGPRNTEAVQLLEIVGDPDAGALRPLPIRIVPRGHHLILDPVLLGIEGSQMRARNNAAGLPEAADQRGANIRLALALEGPLALPGLREDQRGDLVGPNNAGRQSVIRDFRSGNRNDDSATIARGFVRDPLPPRLVGELPFWLEAVDDVNDSEQEVTVFKAGVVHDIDRGDVLRVVSHDPGAPILAAEVIADPVQDRAMPEVDHVRVRVRRTAGLAALDPRRLPGYPQDPSEREAWLPGHAPRALLRTEYAGSHIEPFTGRRVADDPRYFVTFAPEPLPDANGNRGAPNEHVSPFAGAVVRFSKPIDLATVRGVDTLFIGLRNLLDPEALEEFRRARGIDAAGFDPDKFRTPHLVFSRVFDEDGSQTTLRLQPTLGLYLDEAMRAATVELPYYLHLLTGRDGITDLAGNPLDLQTDRAEEAWRLVMPFTVDTRKHSSGRPFHEDNLVVYTVRRHEKNDEDEQPSYYRDDEIVSSNNSTPARAVALDDLFGSHVYDGGMLTARPTGRVTKIADNLNQIPPPPPEPVLPPGRPRTIRRWCPVPDVVATTAGTPFGQGIQNPLNPFGARLQCLWREIDLSLSRVRAEDFNLDVEQMYWAPFQGDIVGFDEFDRVSLYLGHSEFRPEPCVGNFSALPTLPFSGLQAPFERNYVWNPATDGSFRDSGPERHAAYENAPLTIDPNRAIREPNGVNRFLPLPPFERPYFVWRDETVMEQGGVAGASSDTALQRTFQPYILSPWLNGKGERYQSIQGATFIQDGYWVNGNNLSLTTRSQRDQATGGLLGSIALPLLAEFETACDRPDLPSGRGYVALGTNGWQVSLTVQTLATNGQPLPAFRAYSGGRPDLGQGSRCVDPATPDWGTAMGGYTLAGQRTPPVDSTMYWVMVDFLKRNTVVTNGFVELRNPHRVPETFTEDPRLGPYPVADDPRYRPSFTHDFEPSLDRMPGGTSVTVQFRGAGAVDPEPWLWREENPPVGQNPFPYTRPDARNFALDPGKACDAHIRKLDERAVPGGPPRNWWTHFYNRTVTRYVEDPNTLMDPAFTAEHAGPVEGFTPADVRYVHWRYLMSNNVDASPPVSPAIDTFAVAWRYERR